MIPVRYGEPCICEACEAAGIMGKRTVWTADGVYAHGEVLADIYRAMALWDGCCPMRMPRCEVVAFPADRWQEETDS